MGINMSFINAVITSCFVVALFTAIALFQPTYATDASHSPDIAKEKSNTSFTGSALKTVTKSPVTRVTGAASVDKPVAKFPFSDKAIVGITKRVALSNIDSLWLAFDNQDALHNQLKGYPDTVYVYYRDFSSDYSSAQVSVGYPADMFAIPTGKVTLPKGNYITLLPPKKYSDKQLFAIWENIDFRRNINALIEIHQLSKGGDVVSSQILIAYQQ